MQKYAPPSLVLMGSLARLTAADFTSSATDSFINDDGQDMAGEHGMTGSGDSCTMTDGICNYQEP